jgi:hypothetical protein
MLPVFNITLRFIVVHKMLPLGLVLTKLNPVNKISRKIQFNVILSFTPRCVKCSISSFLPKIRHAFFISPKHLTRPDHLDPVLFVVHRPTLHR